MAQETINLKGRWVIIRDVIKEHPTLALTFPYLLASIAGGSYSWMLLASFDINFFHYAQLSDLAVSAFRAGFTVVWAIVCSFALGGFIVWASARKNTKFTLKLMFIGFALIVGFSVGSGVLQGWSDACSVRFSSSNVGVYLSASGSDGKSVQFGRNVALISTAGEMMFVFDRDTKIAAAIPLAQIHHVEFRQH